MIYHGCGNVKAIFQDYIEMGIDAYNPLEVKAGMDVVELRRRYGHRIGFCGNSDIQVWETGDRDAIRREVLRKLNAARAAASSSSPTTPSAASCRARPTTTSSSWCANTGSIRCSSRRIRGSGLNLTESEIRMTHPEENPKLRSPKGAGLVARTWILPHLRRRSSDMRSARYGTSNFGFRTSDLIPHPPPQNRMHPLAASILFHAIGATSAAFCYVPQRKVKRWSWQSYWLTQASFCWLLLPIIGAFLTVPDFWSVVQAAPRDAMLRTFLLGVAYGIGGTAFGVAIRYVGFSITYATAIGISTVVGTAYAIVKGDTGLANAGCEHSGLPRQDRRRPGSSSASASASSGSSSAAWPAAGRNATWPRPAGRLPGRATRSSA